MRNLKLGLRLNENSRLTIVNAIIESKLGDELQKAQSAKTVLADQLYQNIFDYYSIGHVCADGADVSTIPDGLLPTASSLTFVAAGLPPVTLEFGGAKPIPYSYQTQNVTNLIIQDFPSIAEQLEKAAADLSDVETKRSVMHEKLYVFLCEHKTIKSLVADAPDFADLLPDEFTEEQPEGKSLDDILGSAA